MFLYIEKLLHIWFLSPCLVPEIARKIFWPFCNCPVLETPNVRPHPAYVHCGVLCKAWKWLWLWVKTVRLCNVFGRESQKELGYGIFHVKVVLGSPWVSRNSCTGWGHRKWHHKSDKMVASSIKSYQMGEEMYHSAIYTEKAKFALLADLGKLTPFWLTKRRPPSCTRD